MPVLFGLALSVLIAASGVASTRATPQADQAAILAVIETFRTAIIARDGAALTALPLDERITFVGVADEATLVRIRTKRPQATGVDNGSYADFVREVVTGTIASEEKFSNVAIRSDGAIADVYFDYVFEENHAVTNWGHESWSLVHTPQGWKISAIVYSITLPAPTPAK